MENSPATIKMLCYFAFAMIVFLRHLPMEICSDDWVALEKVSYLNLAGSILEKYYYNGKFLTDGLGALFIRLPMIAWKVFDTVAYVLIAWLLSYLLTDNSWKETALVCVLVLLYPVFYLESAGYIHTTTNYVYPVVCLLLIMYHTIEVKKRNDCRASLYVISFASIMYATNQDQYAMVLIGGLFLYLLYCHFSNESTRLKKHVAFLLILSIGCYLVMFFLPGHIYRMNDTSEMERWLPEYVEWSLAKRLYRGYSSTVANLFFNDVKLFSLLCFILAVIAFNHESWLKKTIGLFPVVLIVYAMYFEGEGMVEFPPYSIGMPELVPFLQNPIPLIAATIAVGCIFYTVVTCIESDINRYAVLILLVVAAGSREMMGLSCTLYASSYRTFTFLLYSCIMCCVILMREIKTQKIIRGSYYVWGAILAMLIC